MRNGWKRHFLATGGVVALAMLAAQQVRGQSLTPDWQTAAGGKQAFDVVSVKQNKSGLPPSGDIPNNNVPLGSGPVYSPTGGLFSARNLPLITYIQFAYKMTGNQLQSLGAQLPKWAATDRFDIQARVTGTPTKDQMRLMMQDLLADRFKLTVHIETRQVSVFALVLVKPGKIGPQLQIHPNDSVCSTAPLTRPSAGSEPAQVATVPGGFPATCGGILTLQPSAPGRQRAGARNVTMGVIASTMSVMADLGRPILDQTGLNGVFDFTLEWTPDINGPSPSSAAFQPDPTGPSFLEALKEQLGLKLNSQTGPVDVIVVDHIEQPSEN